jgi:hypothetical protein
MSAGPREPGEGNTTTPRGSVIPTTVRDRSDAQRHEHTPPIPVRRPLRTRHELNSISGGKRTRLSSLTTIALPDVDMAADTDLIQQGYANRIGNSRWTVNGRTYVMESNGTLYPEDGPGFVTLNRRAFKVLTVFVRYNGDEASARKELESDPHIDEHDILSALAVFRQRTGTT